jgi:hypothetical protein
MHIDRINESEVKMELFKSPAAMSTETLVDMLGNGLIFMFCVGFFIGMCLTLLVYVIEASEFTNAIGVPVFALVVLIGLFAVNRYLGRVLLPEL